MNTEPFTVFFDGACPLCRREIGFYRRQKGADQIHWRDVSADLAMDLPAGLTIEILRRRFHVADQTGAIVSGGAAFAALWTQLPRFRLAGRLFSTPPLRALLDVLYNVFLPMRPTLQRAFGARCGQRAFHLSPSGRGRNL